MKFKTDNRYLKVIMNNRVIAVALLSDITFRYSLMLETVIIEAVNAVFQIAFIADLDTWEAEE